MSALLARAALPSRRATIVPRASDRTLRRAQTSRLYDLGAVGVCLAGLAIALLLGHAHRVGTFGVESDFYATYAVQANNLLAGRPYTYPYQPPGYPLLLLAVSALTGDLFLAGKLLSAVSAALLGWVVYLLVKALFGCRVALATAALTTLRLLPFAFLAATDVVGALLMTVPVWVLLRRTRLTWGRCALAGALAGMVYLLRANGVSVAVGLGSAALLVNFNHEAFARRLARAGVFACGALLVTWPWFVTNWQLHGSPFANAHYLQMAAHFHGTGNPALGTALTEAGLRFGSLWEVIARDPMGVCTRYLKDALYVRPIQLAEHGLMFPSYLFGGAGLLLLLAKLSRRRAVFLLVPTLGYLLLGLAWFQLRFYFFLFPVLFLCVAYFFFHPAVRRAFRRIPMANGTVSWVGVTVLAVGLGLDASRESRHTILSEPRYLVAVANFLRDRSSPGDLLIAQKPHLASLAGLQWTFPMAQSAEEFLEKARGVGARYIVYSDAEASRWPGLQSLRNPEALPADFALIYRHDASHTLIYELGRVGGSP